MPPEKCICNKTDTQETSVLIYCSEKVPIVEGLYQWLRSHAPSVKLIIFVRIVLYFKKSIFVHKGARVHQIGAFPKSLIVV